MNSDLDLRLLRTFCAVADELHFRRAAARLHATQSAISQQVQELERRSGVELFRRNRRIVELTDAGRALHQDAREILARAEATLVHVREVAGGRRGSVTFGLVGAATFEAMPMLMTEVKRAAPDIAFRFREMTATEQFAALRDGLIDAGMVRGEPRAVDLEMLTILTEPVICLLPEQHRLAEREEVAISDLRGEPVLNLSRAYDPAAHDFYLGLYRRAGFEPNILQEVSQIATILFVIGTVGCVALGPAGWRVLTRKGVVLRPLTPPVPQVTTRLVWNPKRTTQALRTVLGCAEGFSNRTGERAGRSP
jgi:DNA-binding transcriptional LysR family regulator